jgi:hypothetical protein
VLLSLNCRVYATSVDRRKAESVRLAFNAMKSRELSSHLTGHVRTGSLIKPLFGGVLLSTRHAKRALAQAAMPQALKETASRSSGNGRRSRTDPPVKTGYVGPSILQEVASQLTGTVAFQKNH